MSIEKIKKIISEAFIDLEFEERRHIYTVKGKRLPSVSVVKEQYKEDVDFDKIAGFVAKSKGISKQEVLKEWKQNSTKACEEGTEAHLFSENYGKGWKNKPKTLKQLAAKKFWDELPPYYIPLFFELKMYHKSIKYAGTADLILYDKRNRGIVIVDYKTNKDLYKNYKDKKLKFPFGKLLDNPFNEYQIQLSLYHMMIEQLGVPVINRFIVYLRADGEYNILQCKNYTKKVEQSFKKS